MSNEFGPEQPANRFIWRLAHIAPIGYLVAVAAFVALDLAVGPSLRPWVGAPVIAFVGALFLAHMRHESALCGICAARTPLDGNAAAQRHDIQLRLFHKSRAIVVIMVVLLLGIWVANFGLFDWPDIIGRLALDLSFLEAALTMHVEITHRLLEPWCPYCHWDEGGDHEPAPEPTHPVGEAIT